MKRAVKEESQQLEDGGQAGGECERVKQRNL